MDPISSIQGPGLPGLDQAAAPSSGLNDAARHFAELLAQPESSAPMHEVGQPSAVSHFIKQQEESYHGLLRDLGHASISSQHMTPQQATLKQVEMMFRVVNVTMQHNAFASIAQSAKTGLQTLMKNQ